MIHIVDDDEGVRDALAWMAKSRNLSCVSYASGEEFLAAIEHFEKIKSNDKSMLSHGTKGKMSFDPNGDCVLLDVRMKGISGLATFDILNTKRFKKRLPVIFITGHGEVPMAVDSLKLGAFDFFEKPYDDNELFNRIQEAFEVSVQEGELARIYDRLHELTVREREVLNLILVGKMNKVIADDLGISMRTVEVHRANIFDKMEVKTAVELAGILK